MEKEGGGVDWNKIRKDYIAGKGSYDDHRVEDLDTSMEDHVADEVRYMCMARPIKPIVPEVDDGYTHSAVYQALDVPRGDLYRPGKAARMEILMTGGQEDGET